MSPDSERLDWTVSPGGKPTGTDAEAHATPQARRIELLGQANDVRQASPLVVGEDLEGSQGHVTPPAGR